ncbi:MAG: NfeD family protein [Clostridia bacterium]|nr:NfeD family protein [Clostridia bacterium]
MEWFWLALTIGFCVTELATADLISVWFACGAGLVALLSAFISSLAIYAQFIIFASASVLLLFTMRPLIKRYLGKRKKENKEK